MKIKSYLNCTNLIVPQVTVARSYRVEPYTKCKQEGEMLPPPPAKLSLIHS